MSSARACLSPRLAGSSQARDASRHAGASRGTAGVADPPEPS
jgi:hypothetical protein